MKPQQCELVLISAGLFSTFADSLLRYSLATTIQVILCEVFGFRVMY